MDRARRSHRQLEALIAKLEDRMASLEQRESELQYDLNTNSLPYISTSDEPSSSDRFPQRPTQRPRTNPERGGYQRAPQSRNFIDLLEDEIRRFQLEKQEADIKWQKRQKELFTQLQSIRSDFLPEPESSRSVDSIQSADIENIQRLNRLAEEVSQKKRKVAELERQLEEKVKQTPPSPEQGMIMQRAPGQALRPRLSSTSLAQLHRIMRELENFICAIEEEDYSAPDQVPSEGQRTTPSAMGGDVTQDMIRVQQKEIENLKEQLAMVTSNYLAAKQDSENMRQELNELKVIVLGESSEPKVVTFDETPAEVDSETPPPPETQEVFLGEESEEKSEEEVTKEEVGGTEEEAVPAEEEAIPAEEEAVPAEEEAVPAEEEAVSAEEEAVPAEEAAPAEDEVSTGGEEAAPTEEEAIPSEEEAALAEEEAIPPEEEAIPPEEEAAPAEEEEEEAGGGEGEGEGEEEEAAAAAAAAAAALEEAVPAEEEAAPTEEEAVPAEEEAAPVEEAVPSEEEAAPGEEEAVPAEETTPYEEAAPAEDEVSTGGEEAAPTEEEAAPAEEEAVPTEEEAIPAEEEAFPAEEIAAPAKRPICKCPSDKKTKKKKDAPGGKEAAPSEEEAVPIEEEAAPPEEESVPVEEEAALGDEETAPGEEGMVPPEEEAVPPEDEVCTGGEEAAPTEEEAVPPEDEVSTGGEEAAPTEEEAVPPEDEVSTGGEEAAPTEEEAVPPEDEVSTGGEESAPTEEETIPAEYKAAPTEEEAPVEEEEASPVEEEAAPGGEEAAPTEEETVPTEEEVVTAEEVGAPVEGEVVPVEEEEEEAPLSGEEAAPSEEGAASSEEPVVEEGPEAIEDEDEDLVFTDVSKECCCPEGQCVCCLAEGLESCRLSSIERHECIIPGDAEAPQVHEQGSSEPIIEEDRQLTLDEEEFVEEKPTEEPTSVDLKCFCGQRKAGAAGAGDRPVPEEPAVQEPSKPGAPEETVEQSPASGVAGVSRFSEEGSKPVVAEMLLDIATRITAEHSVDNVEDLARTLEAEMEGKEYCLTNEDIQKILEDIIDSYTQYPFEKEVLAGEMKKIVEDVVQSDAEPCDEKERVAEDIQTILEGIMQRYSVSPMGEGEPEEAKPEVPMKVMQTPEPIGKEPYSLRSSTSDLGCQVLCWDETAFGPVTRQTSSSSDLSCKVLCWKEEVGDEEVRVPEATSEPVEEVDKDQPTESEDKTEPVEEMVSDQPTDSEDKTEPLEEVDTDQTVDSEDQAEQVQEVDTDQTVDSEDKTEPAEEVDTDQTVDSEGKAEPVEEADADQPAEAEEPVEEVDLDEPVDSEDKTEPVGEVDTDQTADYEEKTEPVEEVDTDQPEDSEPVEDVLPEADETAPEDSQEMPLQEDIPSTKPSPSDLVCDKPGGDVPAPECIEECFCTETDELLDKDKIPPTELPASDVVCDKPDEGEVAEDSQEMPLQEEISSTESPAGDVVCGKPECAVKSGLDLPPNPESIDECQCIQSDEMLVKDEVPSTEPPTSDVVCEKPAEGDKSEDLKGETDEADAHRLERVSSSTTQIADEFPLVNEQPYRIEKVSSSLEECAFEFGSFRERDNVPCLEGTKDTVGEVSSVSPESGTNGTKETEEMGDEVSSISPEGGNDEMEERQDGSVAPESGANDIQETGDLSEEGSPATPEVTAEDAEETEDGSEQVSPIDYEGSVDDMKETDGGEEVSPIIPESGTDEINEREGVSEEVVIVPEGGVDESKETPEEICCISSETGGEQEIPEQNIVDENTADVQEQILEPVSKKYCKCNATTEEWKPIGDEIVEKPETTDEVIVDEKADGGIEEKSECIGKENCICSDSVEELYKKESEFTEETPTLTSSPDDAIISECGIEDTDLEGKESKEDFEIDKGIESEKAFLEEEPMVQPGDSVEVMVVNNVGGEDEFTKDDSEKLDESEVSYDGDTESEESDIEQSEDAQPKSDATDDFETVFKKGGIEDIDLICECSDVCLTDYSPSSVEDEDSEYDTALSCPEHDELFTEESYPSDTEPTPKKEYMEKIEIDIEIEKGEGGKPYAWGKGSDDAVNFEGEILFSGMTPHETTSEDSAARVSLDSVLEADDEGQETANEVDQQVMFHYEGVRDILVGEVIPNESKGSVFIPATPSKVQHNPILQQIQPMTRVSQDNQEQGEPTVKTSNSRDSKKRPSSGASKERVRESSIDRKRRWSKVKEEDSDLRVQINELNKRMAVKSKMLLDMEANLNALKGGATKGEQKLPLTKSAMAMVFAAIRDGLGALSCRCFMGGSPPSPPPPCAASSPDPLGNSQPFPCASCCIPPQDTPPMFPCEIKCPFHMPQAPCNRWLLQRPPCSLPPGPGELVARRVDHDSLLVRWGAPRNPSVTGFDIYVNGTVVHRVRGPGRSIAMLTGLNLGCRTVICVYAMTTSGTYGNPMSTVYQPPVCLPCCKMGKNGSSDNYSHVDVHTHGSHL